LSNRQLFTAKVSEKELSSSEHHDINFQPRTSRGWEAVSPCQPTIVGLGKRHKLPERGRGRSPGQKWVLVHFELEKNTSGGKKFVFVDISHFCYTVIVYVSEMGRTDQAPCARGVSPHQPPPLCTPPTWLTLWISVTGHGMLSNVHFCGRSNELAMDVGRQWMTKREFLIIEPTRRSTKTSVDAASRSPHLFRPFTFHPFVFFLVASGCGLPRG